MRREPRLSAFFAILLAFLILMGSVGSIGFVVSVISSPFAEQNDSTSSYGSPCEDSRASFLVSYSRRPLREDVRQLEMLGVKVAHVYKHVDTIRVSVSGHSHDSCLEYLIGKMSSLPFVVAVEHDIELKLHLDVSARAVKARDSSIYSSVWYELGYTGKGVNAAVMDTGVDDHIHLSFPDKFVGGADFSGRIWNTDTNPTDSDRVGHGTHVAGTLLGTGDGMDSSGDGENDYIGVAPGAGLVDVKVTTAFGRASASSTMAALEWCIDNREKYRISVVSMSMGSGDDSDGTGSLDLLVDELVENGIVFVTSMGNDGERKVTSPASASRAIAVGAVDDQNTVDRSDDVIASYSNYGPRQSGGGVSLDDLKPDIVAPGSSIMAPKSSTMNVYHTLTGTSMSAPHVSGTVALMLEANPFLSTEQVRQILRHSAESRGEPYASDIDPVYNRHYGWGILDSHIAVTMALDTPPPHMGFGITHVEEDHASFVWDGYYGTGFQSYSLYVYQGDVESPVAVFSDMGSGSYFVDDLQSDKEYNAFLRLSTWWGELDSRTLTFTTGQEWIDDSGYSNIPPVAYINSIHPRGAEVGTSITFSGSGYASEGRVVEYEWVSSIDGLLSTRPTFSSQLSIGEHDISFRVRDNVGAWSDAAVEEVLMWDVGGNPYAPSISIFRPRPGQSIGRGLHNVSGVVESQRELEGVRIRVYGQGDWEPAVVRLVEDGLYDWYAVLDTTRLQPGEYILEVKAEDVYGTYSLTRREIIVGDADESILNSILGFVTHPIYLSLLISAFIIGTASILLVRRRKKKRKGYSSPQVYVIKTE